MGICLGFETIMVAVAGVPGVCWLLLVVGVVPGCGFSPPALLSAPVSGLGEGKATPSLQGTTCVPCGCAHAPLQAHTTSCGRTTATAWLLSSTSRLTHPPAGSSPAGTSTSCLTCCRCGAGAGRMKVRCAGWFPIHSHKHATRVTCTANSRAAADAADAREPQQRPEPDRLLQERAPEGVLLAAVPQPGQGRQGEGGREGAGWLVDWLVGWLVEGRGNGVCLGCRCGPRVSSRSGHGTPL
jgi:hypothetical protein